jgi:hypothetical protein
LWLPTAASSSSFSASPSDTRRSPRRRAPRRSARLSVAACMSTTTSSASARCSISESSPPAKRPSRWRASSRCARAWVLVLRGRLAARRVRPVAAAVARRARRGAVRRNSRPSGRCPDGRRHLLDDPSRPSRAGDRSVTRGGFARSTWHRGPGRIPAARSPIGRRRLLTRCSGPFRLGGRHTPLRRGRGPPTIEWMRTLRRSTVGPSYVSCRTATAWRPIARRISPQTQAAHARISEATPVASVCPYCATRCDTDGLCARGADHRDRWRRTVTRLVRARSAEESTQPVRSAINVNP